MREGKIISRAYSKNRVSSYQRVLTGVILLLLVARFAHAGGQSSSPTVRLITWDDLFNVQQLARYYGGGVAISPDGTLVAFAIQRPYRTRKLYTSGLAGSANDIYLAQISGGLPVKITDGSADG